MTTPDPAAIAKGLTELQSATISISRPDSPVSIWFRDDRLFERGPDGYVRLTPLGVAVREALKGGGYANETK